MDALQRAGIEGRDISLYGDSIDTGDERAHDRDRERGGVRHVGIRILIAGTIGHIVGALAGFLVAVMIYGSQPSGGPTGWLGYVIGGALAVGVVSMLGAGVFSLDLADRWELTFGKGTGPAVVAVQSDDESKLARARKALSSHGGRDIKDTDVETMKREAG